MLPLWALTLIAAASIIAGALFLVFALRAASKTLEVPCGGCGKILMAHWTQCAFCNAPRGFKQGVLEFVSGSLKGRTVALQVTVTTIGTEPSSTIVVEDRAVSRRHVGIRRLPEGYELADLGSTNGVFVNGVRVPKQQLAPGDIIRIGATEMVFRA